ncbi:MAG: PilN domain-containing protein [Gaiellaceae bacterium]|jgi:Tfp pilus assembly protein PilN
MRAINLLPKDAERARRTAPDPALLVGVAGFAVVVAALLFMYMSASQKVQNKQSERDSLSSELTKINTVNPPPKILPIQAALASIEQARIGAAASALSYRIPWDYILGQIALVLPADVKLTTLTATAPISPNPQITASLTATSGVPENLTIGGWALAQESVALLMTRLIDLPPLTNVTLDSTALTKGVRGQSYYQFVIKAQIRTPGAVS